jgi:3-methyl-2-oxobutanoate hydroxymethyltransferase
MPIVGIVSCSEMSLAQYIKEVKEGSFPDDEHSYSVNEAEYEKFTVMVAKRKQI